MFLSTDLVISIFKYNSLTESVDKTYYLKAFEIVFWTGSSSDFASGCTVTLKRH